MITRRQFTAAVPWVAGSPLALSGCSREPAADSYESVAAATWHSGAVQGLEGQALGRELVRCATLAPSSHNTQCWKFALQDEGITILPDLSRRCPAVDPDDHHLFVSLGCAAENLVQAAQVHGRHAEVTFDARRDAVRVLLSPMPAQASPLFDAIASRQCTRGDYDGKPLSSADLALLERAGTSGGVRLVLLTERPAIERVLERARPTACFSGAMYRPCARGRTSQPVAAATASGAMV